MIPNFNISNVLPPFIGADPTKVADNSPFVTSMTELVSVFGTSASRLTILDGLLRYRAKLKSIGITTGFQLIDGSFVENCEVLRGRPPTDIDIVTFAYAENAIQLLESHIDLFDPELSKNIYYCDAYFVDLNSPQHIVANSSFYWFGLFSHQRATSLWKGMLKLPLVSDDDLVPKLIENEFVGGTW